MKSYWIWNKGDYEIFHSNSVNSRRQQYGMDYPPFWRLYGVETNVVFFAERTVEKDGYLILHLNGKGYLKIDDVMKKDGVKIPISKGKHRFSIHLFNLTGLPAAYIESDVLATDGGWYTLDPEQKKIGVGYSEKYYMPNQNPESFAFSYKTEYPVSKKKINNGILFKFEREIFGCLYINVSCHDDKIHVSYGESCEEALDIQDAVVQEDICGAVAYKLRQRAFRYIFITGTDDADIKGELEYQELKTLGSFRCDNEDVNKIWDICAYTLHLNMREVLTEAIKRDRWLWGGDAYQAFKFVKYLTDESDTVRRSIIGLRGKEPFCEHVNTITDYTLFWIIGLYEYYLNYKDTDFIEFMYPRAVTAMDFCDNRGDENGFIVKKFADWIFIDWSDIDKTGAVCAEQMLYIAANRAMAELADILHEDGTKYSAKADALTEKVNKMFWSDKAGAFIDSFESGNNHVTRHANIFAVMYDIATEKQCASIMKNVLFNDSITKITTPYFEGYELDVMGKTGNLEYIYNMLISYWKGMLDLGATTVWEEYNPELSGAEHYAMYGDKYQKSLCHAWGASPIYLLGRYFLGVREKSAGWESFTVSPQLSKFGFIDGSVPVRDGMVYVYLSNEKLSVLSTVAGGELVWNNKRYTLTANKRFEIEL